jgi:Family of unknown function (DUF6174)
MNRHRLAFGALCALIPLAGCASSLRALEDDRVRAKATWEAHRPEHYEFTVGVYCFCPTVGGVTFRVANGVSQVMTETPERELATYQDFHTIDEIFEFLGESISTKPYKMDVVYNPELGYPVSVGIDRRRRIVDDELGVRVWGFKVLPAPAGGVPEP